MKVLEYGCVFAAGGLGYGGLELLWRGRTHWSMLLCGGVCAVLIYLIAGRERTVLWRRWTLCAAAVLGPQGPCTRSVQKYLEAAYRFIVSSPVPGSDSLPCQNICLGYAIVPAVIQL